MDLHGWEDFPYTGKTNWMNYQTNYRPMLQVDLEFNGETLPSVSALIDSGAEDTLFDADVAEALGIDITTLPAQILAGVGGDTMGYMCTINLKAEKFEGYFSTEVMFVKNLGVGGLLGQRDFFTRFYIYTIREESEFFLPDACASD